MQNAQNFAAVISRMVLEPSFFGTFLDFGFSRDVFPQKAALGKVGAAAGGGGAPLLGPQAPKMKEIGVHNGADLRNLKGLELKTHFGKVGTHFYRVVRSLQDNPVNPNRIRKSIGAEQTFNQDIETESFMLDKLSGIAEELERRMSKSSNKGKTITIKIKYSDFSQQTRSKTVENYVSTKEEFFPIIKDLLFQKSLDKPVRLLGIAITKLFNDVNMKENPVSLQLKFNFNQLG